MDARQLETEDAASAELLALALLQVSDRAAAASLVDAACARSADPEGRKRLVVELAEASRREAAARRVEAWRGLSPRHAWLAAPVVLAFAVGLAGGAVASLLRVKEPPRLELGGAPVAVDGEARFQHPGGLVAVVLYPRLRESAQVMVNGKQVVSGLWTQVVVPPKALLPGKENRLTFAPPGSVESVRVEAVALPSLDRLNLMAVALARTQFAEKLEDSDETAAPYRAYRALVEARVLLEVAPGTRPEGYPRLEGLLAAAEARLDAQCNRMFEGMDEAEPAAQLLMLQLVVDAFPGYAHGCRLQADARLAALGR